MLGTQLAVSPTVKVAMLHTKPGSFTSDTITLVRSTVPVLVALKL